MGNFLTFFNPIYNCLRMCTTKTIKNIINNNDNNYLNQNQKKSNISNFNNEEEKLKDQKVMEDKSKRQCTTKLKFTEKNYAIEGLNNIGNNCYINSVLQILKNIPKFTYNLSNINNNSDKFLNSLKDLLINICKSNISSFSPINKFRFRK